MPQQFLSITDAYRATSVFGKLTRHEISAWALTGGLAVEIHRLRHGRPSGLRALNDLDFVTDSFDCVPDSLAGDFLFRHIHPLDPPGKTMLQLVDPVNALRIDVFRANGATMERTVCLEAAFGTVRLISLEDLVARSARLVLEIGEGRPASVKHATDFLRLLEFVNPAKIETAWQDHRKPQHPATFEETRMLLENLISNRKQLLITPKYSTNSSEKCLRCAPTSAFRLADP